MLIPLARKNDLWMTADMLREGAVVARIKLGDIRGARAALTQLASQSLRERNDVRPQLLDAWVRAGETRIAGRSSRQ